jgi:hypothetical protein
MGNINPSFRHHSGIVPGFPLPLPLHVQPEYQQAKYKFSEGSENNGSDLWVNEGLEQLTTAIQKDFSQVKNQLAQNQAETDQNQAQMAQVQAQLAKIGRALDLKM